MLGIRRLTKKIPHFRDILKWFKPQLNFRTWLFFVLSLFIVGLGIYFLRQATSAKAAWFDTGYSYRQRIPISNSGSTLTDYQVGITVNTSTLISASKMQSDCDDMRFTTENGEEIAYWIEENNPGCNNSATRVWLNVPSIPGSDTNIYFYYGNPTTTGKSDGSSTFPFFDDFNGSSLNGRWNNSGGTVSFVSGELSVSSGALYTTAPVVATAQNYIYESRVKWTNTGGTYGGIQIAEVTNPQGNNAGAHALVYLMASPAANYNITAFASNGSATAYGITNATTQFTATANTYTVAGFSLDSTNLRYYNNRAQTNSYTGTWTEAPYMSLGYFTGSTAGSADGKDMTFDWVLVRKYAATVPTIGTFASEEKVPGPAAYWKLDEGSGSSVYDSTENGNNGTLGTGASTPTRLRKDQCIQDTCLMFDGTDDAVSLPSVKSEIRFGTSSSFSISAWVKPVKYEGYRPVVAGQRNSSLFFGIINGTVGLGLDDGFMTSSSLVPLNRWSHIAVVYNGSSGILYINGYADNTVTNSDVASTAYTTLFIGHESRFSETFMGAIDEVKVFSYARTSAEVRTEYIQGASDSGSSAVFGRQDQSYLSEGLVGHWKMDEVGVSGSNWTAVDASGNSNNGTGVGNASVGTTNPGKYGNGGYLDGNGDYINVPDSNALDITETLTLSAWIKTADGTSAIASKYDTDNFAYWIGFISSQLRLYLGSSGGAISYSGITSPGILDNQWHHVVAVYKPGETAIYIDGRKQVINDQVGTIPTSLYSGTAEFQIGRDAFNDNATSFTGSLDEVRVYNRAFTDREVEQLYEWAPDPVGYWKMEREDPGFDSSINGNTAPYPDSYSGMAHGYIEGNLTIIPEQWAGAFNAGEFDITCTGGDGTCYFTDANGRHETPNIDNGIACVDALTGTGYIMYSEANVHTRFSGNPPGAGNAQNYICVRYNSGWQYDDNTAWRNFTPVSTDTLIAEVNFTSNTVSQLDDIPSQSAGKIGGGLYFDGTDDAIGITSPVGIPNINAPKSVNFWVNPERATGSWVTLINGTNSVQLGAFGGTVRAWKYGGTMLVGETYPVTNSWYHFGYTYDGLTHKMYLDGNLVDNSTVPSQSGSVSNIFFSTYGAGLEELTGTLDEVKIYNYPQTQKQVVQDMEANFPEPARPIDTPKGYWKFDEGTGTTTYNSGGEGSVADGTISGASWTSSGKYGSALSYDGTNDQTTVSSVLGLAKTTDMTVSLWVNLPDTSESGAFVKIGSEDASDNDGLGVGVGASSFETEGNDLILLYEGVRWVDTATTIGTGWHHIVATVDSSGVPTAYIDGVSAGSFAGTGMNAPENDDSIKIGGYTSSTPSNRFGQYTLDEVKIYDYAFTAADAAEAYNARPALVPVSHWKFDEGYGSIVNNTLDPTTTMQGYLQGATWTTDGQYGKALDFDGSGDQVQIPHNDAVNFSTSDDFTVSAWFRSPTGTVVNPGGAIVEKWIAPGGYPYALRMTTGGLVYGARYNGTTSSTAISTLAYNDNKWHQMIFKKNGTTLYLYVDGQVVSTVTDVTGTTTNTNPLFIGSRNGAVSSHFKGQIDDVKIYNYPLTEDEIKTEFNQSKAIVLGSVSTGVGGTTPSNSASREYCVPGDSTTCNTPLAEWKLDENTGATAYDSSGNGRNGTFGTGGSAPKWATGIEGPSVYFDGTQDVIDTSSEISLSSATSFTVSGWIKPTALNTTDRYVIDRTTGTNELINIYSTGTDDLSFRLRGDNAAGITSTTAPNVLVVGQWLHFTGVRDVSDDRLKLYINGQFASQATDATTGTNSPIIRIGNHSGAANGWMGMIDQVRIYNYARTAAQIAWEYNKGAPIAHYKMDECEGTTIYNSAPTFNDAAAGNDGTLTIAAGGSQTTAGTCATSGAWANGASGKRGSAMSFDGTDDRVEINSQTLLSTNHVSVAAWIKTNGRSVAQAIITKRTSLNNGQFLWYLDSNNKLVFDRYTPTSGEVGGHNVIPNNVWTHVAVILKDTENEVQFYINGQLDATRSYTETFSGATTSTVVIGRSGASCQCGGLDPWSTFDGLIDDVRIFHYALTPHQIKTIYNNGAVSFE